MAFVYLATTTPFVMDSPSQFRPGPPPALTSERYAKDYNEVMEVGSTLGAPGGGRVPGPRRHRHGALLGRQHPRAMEPGRCATSRSRGSSASAIRRGLLALANLAGADAGIGVWDSKIHYNFWRPITAIHQGNADGNDKTAGDTELDAVHPERALPGRLAERRRTRTTCRARTA